MRDTNHSGSIGTAVVEEGLGMRRTACPAHQRVIAAGEGLPDPAAARRATAACPARPNHAWRGHSAGPDRLRCLPAHRGLERRQRYPRRECCGAHGSGRAPELGTREVRARACRSIGRDLGPPEVTGVPTVAERAQSEASGPRRPTTTVTGPSWRACGLWHDSSHAVYTHIAGGGQTCRWRLGHWSQTGGW